MLAANANTHTKPGKKLSLQRQAHPGRTLNRCCPADCWFSGEMDRRAAGTRQEELSSEMPQGSTPARMEKGFSQECDAHSRVARLLCWQTPCQSRSLNILPPVTLWLVSVAQESPSKPQKPGLAAHTDTARAAVDAPRLEAGAKADDFGWRDNRGSMCTQIRSREAPPSKTQTKLRVSPSSLSH